MSLRAKLLLLSLLTLILPWAGWQYAQQMDTTLRTGQEESLLTTADVLSRVVAGEPELLYRANELRDQFNAERGDLFAPLLPTAPLVDGFPDEWPQPTRSVPGFSTNPQQAEGAAAPIVRLGVYGRWIYAYIEVIAPNLQYEVPADSESQTQPRSDRVIILTRDALASERADASGTERAWSISAVAPGPLIVRASEIGAPWRPLNDAVLYVSGIWRETATGYAIELRAPLNLFGTQLSVLALDRDGGTVAKTRLLAWLHTGSEALKRRLEQYAPDGVRVSVVDNNGWLLASTGSINVDTRLKYPDLSPDENGFMRSIYGVLFPIYAVPPPTYGLPYGMWGAPVDVARGGKRSAIWFEKGSGQPSLVRAAVPVRVGEQSLGALVIEQLGEQLMVVREQALTRLMNVTLLAMAFAIVVTIVFAARLSHRIRRLSRAASTALSAEGRIEPNIPGTRARDEIGALARSYATLLGRVKEYTNYLQTLGTKLSHELRTPLTIVSSSLDNLVSEEKLPANAQSYVDRARSGASRMHAILTALSEATRVEQSIEHTERVQFDLSELVRNIGQAYQHTFAAYRVETLVADSPCRIEGSPDLIAQLLDKLMDNAADFTPTGAPITISLDAGARTCRLSVRNEGPLLPLQLDGRLFESLVSSRGSVDGKPHLGLGLYIVRLIADFHGGQATATNLSDGSGVEVAVELPIVV